MNLLYQTLSLGPFSPLAAGTAKMEAAAESPIKIHSWDHVDAANPLTFYKHGCALLAAAQGLLMRTLPFWMTWLRSIQCGRREPYTSVRYVTTRTAGYV